MKRDHESPLAHSPHVQPADGSAELRTFAAWMGLVLIAFGVAVAGYMFFQIGQVVLDPRGFETQVDRWEFVVRGRSSDELPQAYEVPDMANAADANAGGGATPAPSDKDEVEQMATFVGRVASKSARPAALFLLVLVITILVRIAIAIINAGIRLVYVTAGDKEFMKRIIDELVDQRRGQ